MRAEIFTKKYARGLARVCHGPRVDVGGADRGRPVPASIFESRIRFGTGARHARTRRLIDGSGSGIGGGMQR